jgi:hypothetical protein
MAEHERNSKLAEHLLHVWMPVDVHQQLEVPSQRSDAICQALQLLTGKLRSRGLHVDEIDSGSAYT